jgi:hypothetical protein
VTEFNIQALRWFLIGERVALNLAFTTSKYAMNAGKEPLQATAPSC